MNRFGKIISALAFMAAVAVAKAGRTVYKLKHRAAARADYGKRLVAHISKILAASHAPYALHNNITHGGERLRLRLH